MTGLCGFPLAYTVYLCVKQLPKTISMSFNVNNLPLASQYRKRLLQISANSVRNIHNHAKVEKTSTTCNNKRWFMRGQPSCLVRVETWDGWLIACNMHDIFVMQNRFILHGYLHFKTAMHFLKLSTHWHVAKGHQESAKSLLRPSLPEDQAGVIHAISPIWMKLCQIEGTTKQL